MTDLITERSVRFIEQNSKRPFFIDVSYNAAHWPYQRPDEPNTARDNGRHLGPFDEPTSTRADYVAMPERADKGVGQIPKALDKSGLRENTVSHPYRRHQRLRQAGERVGRRGRRGVIEAGARCCLPPPALLLRGLQGRRLLRPQLGPGIRVVT